jgi:hypothetical protein
VYIGRLLACLLLAGCESRAEAPIIKMAPQPVPEATCLQAPVFKAEVRPILTRGGSPGTCLTRSAVLAEQWPIGCGNADIRPIDRKGAIKALPLVLVGRSGRVEAVRLHDSCGDFSYDLPRAMRTCLERELAQWTFVPDGKGCPPVYYEEEQVLELSPTNERSGLGGGNK